MSSALAIGGVLLLAILSYSLGRYKDHAKKCRARAITSLEILKPSCPV